MNWNDLCTAFGLLFIIEAIWPFLSPEKWQAMLRTIATQKPKTIRMIAFISMLIGLLLLYLNHH